MENLFLYISLCYIIKKYKTFFRIDIQLYQHSWKLGKLEIVWNTIYSMRDRVVLDIQTDSLVFPLNTFIFAGTMTTLREEKLTALRLNQLILEH